MLVLLVVVVATFERDERFLWPPLAAAPLLPIELWFDMRSRSRRLLLELAGTVGIGSVAASIILADGKDASLALGLWLVVAARAAAAFPYAGTQVLRARNRPHHLWHSDLAHLIALAAIIVAWSTDATPFAAAIDLGMRDRR